MQRPAKPWTSVRLRDQPPYTQGRVASSELQGKLLAAPCDSSPNPHLPHIMCAFVPCPGGETGRRKGLKIPRWRHRAGSTPAPGTRSHIWRSFHPCRFALLRTAARFMQHTLRCAPVTPAPGTRSHIWRSFHSCRFALLRTAARFMQHTLRCAPVTLAPGTRSHIWRSFHSCRFALLRTAARFMQHTLRCAPVTPAPGTRSHIWRSFHSCRFALLRTAARFMQHTLRCAPVIPAPASPSLTRAGSGIQRIPKATPPPDAKQRVDGFQHTSPGTGRTCSRFA